MNGKFVISLDFELFWGIRDKRSLEDYSDNLLGVWDVIPELLDLFDTYKVRATWATVGFLFADSFEELHNYYPDSCPDYVDRSLNPYLEDTEFIQSFDPRYFFAKDLLNEIVVRGSHEIASHSFSHYYCLEPGQELRDFKADLAAAINIAGFFGVELKSFVFPRNQTNDDYLDVIKDFGFTSYRGNEKSWIYSPSNRRGNNLVKRAIRFLDAYFNITGHNCYPLGESSINALLNIPSSRFLRPYDSRLALFEHLRLNRILRSMTYAAKTGQVFHIWWHPHNFGVNKSNNMKFIKKILVHYSFLNSKYGFESVTMGYLSQEMMNQVN